MARDNGGMKSRQRPSATAQEQSFRDVLAAALDVTDVTPAELARRIGSSGPAISQWLNKGNIPDLVIVIKIEDALDLPFGTLIQHHSPEAWAIIEMKAGSKQASPVMEKKDRRGLDPVTVQQPSAQDHPRHPA